MMAYYEHWFTEEETAAATAGAAAYAGAFHGGNVAHVGRLGEIAFERWAASESLLITKLDATSFDYHINGQRVEVRTKRRRGCPQLHYDVQMRQSDRHKPQPDWYVFLSLDYSQEAAWLVGGMPGGMWWWRSLRYGAGETARGTTYREDTAVMAINDIVVPVDVALDLREGQ